MLSASYSFFFLFCCSFSVHILACCAEALPVSIRGKCFMEADFFFSAIAYDIAFTFVSAAVSRHDSYVCYRVCAYVAAVAMEIVIAIAWTATAQATWMWDETKNLFSLNEYKCLVDLVTVKWNIRPRAVDLDLFHVLSTHEEREIHFSCRSRIWLLFTFFRCSFASFLFISCIMSSAFSSTSTSTSNTSGMGMYVRCRGALSRARPSHL